VNSTVEVSATDTGIGIAAEDCDAVFQEFRQVGTQSKGKAQGIGLGLALTKKSIKLHGGKIGFKQYARAGFDVLIHSERRNVV
jgi:signal transduction histidine kinase